MSFRLVMGGQSLAIDHVTTDLRTGRQGVLTPLHQHPVFHLMYITSGLGTFTVNECTSEAAPGLLYIISPNERHQFCGNESNPLTNVECTFLLRDELGEPAVVNFFNWIEAKRGRSVPRAVRTEPLLVPAHLRPFLMEGFQRLLDPAGRYVTGEHLALMVADLMLRVEETVWQCIQGQEDDDSAGGAEEVARLKQYMKTHIGDNIKLEDLAQLVHWTPNYLCRVFKMHTSEAPIAYLQRLRMTEAEKLLLYTDFPVFTISQMLGYEDPSYFARLFRRSYGRAPSAYRIR
ncbi:AraC family transcriptional regulator [Paenibacillus sp. GCM10027626]|uniref:AraC family transcriptional regulator n=1 Tax=Paenibacillus sp. GCM10027626 TaxID=3273411 RepID=UPI00363C536E